MPMKSYSLEQIVKLQRNFEVEISDGKTARIAGSGVAHCMRRS
jgi:RNase P/RNase MRP subunit p29